MKVAKKGGKTAMVVSGFARKGGSSSLGRNLDHLMDGFAGRGSVKEKSKGKHKATSRQKSDSKRKVFRFIGETLNSYL